MQHSEYQSHSSKKFNSLKKEKKEGILCKTNKQTNKKKNKKKKKEGILCQKLQINLKYSQTYFT
jgi:hypothetical protein